MDICTIGFTQKSAREFFGALKAAGVRRLIDIRLKNTAQLAGFTKKDDLAYFLQEICRIAYTHEPRLAPPEELLHGYQHKEVEWAEFERRFIDTLKERRVEKELDRTLFGEPVVLLCSEPTAEHCHRRLVAEYLAAKWPEVRVKHL